MRELGQEFLRGTRVEFNTVIEMPIVYELCDEAVAAAVGFIDDHLRAAAAGFEADLPGAREEVEEVFAAEDFAEGREHGFFDKVGCDAGIAVFFVVKKDAAALKFASDNTHKRSTDERRYTQIKAFWATQQSSVFIRDCYTKG